MKSLNEPKQGFWGSLASKAKALLDKEDPPQHLPQNPTTRMDHNNMPFPLLQELRRILQLWRRLLQGSFKKHVRRLKKSRTSRTPLRYKQIWRFNSRLLATVPALYHFIGCL
ncbi:unnamed protein product [Brassica rapa subsp. narinosa]